MCGLRRYQCRRRATAGTKAVKSLGLCGCSQSGLTFGRRVAFVGRSHAVWFEESCGTADGAGA